MDMPKLNGWMEELGWSQGDLAQAADIEERSIQRMYKRGTLGRRAYATLLENMQHALIEKAKRIGQPVARYPRTLKLSSVGREEVTESRIDHGSGNVATEVAVQEVEISLPRETMDSITPETRDKVIKVLQRLLHTNMPIVITGYREGSVKMTIAVSPGDAERLKRAINRGDLDELGISYADLVQDADTVDDEGDEEWEEVEDDELEEGEEDEDEDDLDDEIDNEEDVEYEYEYKEEDDESDKRDKIGEANEANKTSASAQCLEHQILEHIKQALRVTLDWNAPVVAMHRKLSSLQFTIVSFARHFERVMLIEEVDGYLGELTAPKFQDRKERLARDHDDFRNRINDIVPKLKGIGECDEAVFESVSNELRVLLDDIDRHDLEEVELLQEALLDDLDLGV